MNNIGNISNSGDTKASCHLRVGPGVGRGERDIPRSTRGVHMYTFAIVALLALATVKIVDFLADNLAIAARMRSLLTFIIAVGAVVWLDFSMFEEWGTAVRDRDLGMWITGFVVAGLTVPWRALFSYVTHDRAQSDETLGHHMPLRKVA